MRDNDERVISLKVYQDDICFIVLNLYPYNPAHLMVVPLKHITKYTELTKKEIIHTSRVLQGIQLMVNEIYKPSGYNIGINQGRQAGGSIEHLHFHFVPRFGSELGFIDIIGKSRALPEGLDDVKKKIENKIDDYLNEDFFKSF